VGFSFVVGLAIATMVGVVLVVLEVSFGAIAGAFLGGFVAGWLLGGQRRKAAIVGFLIGLASFPVQLLVYVLVVSSGMYTPPPVPEIPETVLLTALAISVLIQIVSATVGGLFSTVVRRPPVEAVGAAQTRLYLPPPPPRPDKCCVQCGVGLATETLVCPACQARQPA
jgi:hypothetical protein